ncbi:uncharacterized protein LOC126906343 isoform X2 [Daktulosphaira vitifoliae]|uniref:uncharacterized protein LOC126906343 isoform X2 n=1 Tax=Daktulosphaira vitifoliae TaxID=58002 RepID=UPI0021AABD7F|nr:uncharacterized protein LOC126906343 isoform X2 [Daktulosphaira vitifoliae]
MEARINNLVRSIFLLNDRLVPPSLDKHLTQGLDEFTYRKSLIVSGKVNSSLLANPGGSTFVFFMYQFCIYVLRCDLVKKGLPVINEPLYNEDPYIENKIQFFRKLIHNDFTEANEKMNLTETLHINFTKKALKLKEIIQESKQQIKDNKSELQTIMLSDNIENEVIELRKQNIYLRTKFNKNRLVIENCITLAKVILKNSEIWDAEDFNFILSLNKEITSGNNGKTHLVKLLKIIKNSLDDFNRWCNHLDEKQEDIYNIVLETEKIAEKMSNQLKQYKTIAEHINDGINNLKLNNKNLEEEIFCDKYLGEINPKLLKAYKKLPTVILRPNKVAKSNILASNDSRRSRRSILLHGSKPYVQKSLCINEIKNLYNSIMLIQNNQKTSKCIVEHSVTIVDQSSLSQFSANDLQKNQTKCEAFKLQNHVINCELNKKESSHLHNISQFREDEVKSVSISRRSIENIKQKFIRIKNQSHMMSTIPHSPQSPKK